MLISFASVKNIINHSDRFYLNHVMCMNIFHLFIFPFALKLMHLFFQLCLTIRVLCMTVQYVTRHAELNSFKQSKHAKKMR